MVNHYLCFVMEKSPAICPTCPFMKPYKSVVHHGLALLFTSVAFEEVSIDLDYVSDVDYAGYVANNVAFGIQCRSASSLTDTFNYSASERMRASFQDFEADFGGRVFIVFSLDGEIANTEVIPAIEQEIARLSPT